MISIIAAIDKNRGLGKNNKLVWNIPEDLNHFKKITNEHPVIMGRKTFESIGRPLSNRANIVITRNKTYSPSGVVVKHSLLKAIEYAQSIDQEEIFVIGGAEIYKQALPYADRLYLTIIEEEFDVDSYFPDYSEFHLEDKSGKNIFKGIEYSFHTYIKNSS